MVPASVQIYWEIILLMIIRILCINFNLYKLWTKYNTLVATKQTDTHHKSIQSVLWQDTVITVCYIYHDIEAEC